MNGRSSDGRLLEGCAALVTGGASGIGRGTAKVLCERGATVIVIGLTDAECGEARTAGFLAYPLDVRDRRACDEAVARAASDLGGLSVLTSGAGVHPQISITDMADEDIPAIFGVNVTDTIHMIQAAATALRESGRGRVVVTLSITSNVTGYPGWSHYGATKAAQMSFVRSAAMELAKDGITVNAIMPGNVVTPGLVALGEEYMRRVTAAAPLGCLDEPRGVNEAVAFPASDGVRYITGQAVIMGNGQILPESPETIADM